ncbi:MAG: cytochrome c oxidase subunit II [Nevskia sp.]|jgi:cytochrome c oxidase subunit 2|nr:cytochrome c oxidase subunit II [Nevskia sp.]MCK9385846.1 cytochrome c oxidase subunit II [Nevskia sp.]
MSNLNRSLRAAAVALTVGFASLAARAADTMDNAYWNMPKGVTDVSHEVFALHMAAFWVCVVIGVVVFGVMFYSVFAHRRSKHPVPATFHHSTLVEIIWTAIPFVILIGLAVPAAGTLIKEYDTRNADMTIKITGYQWKWQYEYVGENVSFFSTLEKRANEARQLHSGIDPKTVPNYLHDVDNYLVLPVGKKVRFLLTSNDVIHGWWMPDLAIKKDAIPGFINEMWTKINEPGIYRGQCTVLCGRDHGFMPIVVEAKSEADYAAWLEKMKGGETVAAATTTASDAVVDSAQPAAVEAPVEAAPVEVAAAPAAAVDKDDLMKAGAKVYAANCQVCHQADGTGLPPSFPSLVGGKVVTGPIDAHITQVLKGKNAMPPFPQLSDADVAAVVTYERNAFGNKVGDAAQAGQVAKLR